MPNETQIILSRLDDLERRMSEIESRLNISRVSRESSEATETATKPTVLTTSDWA